MEEIMEAAERRHAEWYAGDVGPEDSTVRYNLVGKLPKADEEGKAVGDDGITVDLLKNGRDIIQEKLAK